MLKQISWIIVVVFVSSSVALAENGSIVMRSNLIKPSHGKSFVSNDVNFYLNLSEKFGIGAETCFSPENDYFKIRPLATWALDKNWSLVGGFSSDSSDRDYLNAGFAYFAKLGKSNSFYISSVYYRGFDEKANDFIDSFVEVKHDFGNDFALAIEVAHDYWSNSGANWLLVGPALHYKVSEKIDLFGRIAGESDLDRWNTIDFRVGLKYSF
jgi:hypothetical protein